MQTPQKYKCGACQTGIIQIVWKVINFKTDITVKPCSNKECKMQYGFKGCSKLEVIL